MPVSNQQTLFAFDCGATNWRLYRMEYRVDETCAQILGEPQPASMTSFVDRRLPAVICLNPEGTALESFGDVAQQQLEDEQNRERVRDYFKPCIGSHLDLNPLPHQKRYTHAEALQYTQMLLQNVLEQLRQEKWRAGAFDDRVRFTFAYPVHWRHDHEGAVFAEFEKMVRSCFDSSFEQIRFVSEPEGAILCLQRRGLLNAEGDEGVTLIVDVGGSTTDIVAGKVDRRTNRLDYLGRYGEPFGGGLYDSELAKHIADDLAIPASAMADDPSALVALRIIGQRLKESLSRQVLHGTQSNQIHQRTVTLVMRNGTVYRRVIGMDEAEFNSLTSQLDRGFEELMINALKAINLKEKEVGQVVLVGGGSQLFTIIRHLRQRFGKDKVVLADNPDEIVVQGIGLEYGSSVEKIEPSIHFPGATPGIEKPASISPAQPGSSWNLLGPNGNEISLCNGVTKIGRGEGNDLQLNDLKASRFHAELNSDGENLAVVDLGSTNGTFINGKRLLPYQPETLAAGDEIIFGKTKFVCNR
jgi:molecular chaperone DnaK (HSP70)